MSLSPLSPAHGHFGRRALGWCLLLTLFVWFGCTPEPRRKTDGSTDSDSGITVEKQADRAAPPERRVPPNSCGAVLACAKTTCASNPTPDCFDKCAANIAEPGKGQWGAVKTCWTGKCQASCQGKGPGCLASCLTTVCKTEVLACGGSGGSATCKDSVACLQGCKNNDAGCVINCFAGAKADAQNAVQTHFACVASDVPSKPSQDACNKAEVACLCPGLVPGSGQNTCQSLEGCRKGCGADRCCLAKCEADASQEAIQLQSSLASCKQQQNPTPAQQQKCSGDHIKCYCPANVPGSGTKTCNAYAPCLDKCKDGDICCAAACRASLQPAVIQNADDFLRCYLAQCPKSCPGNDKSCLDLCSVEKCGSPLVTCYCPGTKAPGTGTKKCGAATDCLKKCKPDDTCCFAQCGSLVRASSFQKLMKLVKCLPKCGCADGDAKCSEKCASSGKCRSEGISCAFD